MTKETKLEFSKSEMDSIIAKQETEQAKTSSRQSEYQNASQNMQLQEMHVRLRLMSEELVTKQLNNIITISNAIKTLDNERVKETMQSLLDGYAVKTED
jgi:hypothetical protein